MHIKTVLKLLFVTLLSTLSKEVSSQSATDFDTYTTLKSSGSLPNDITKLSFEKYKEELAKIQQKDLSRSEKQLEKQFQLDANYAIDRMLLSGRVLYNDPISLYAAKVAKEILKDEPETYNKLRFYSVRFTNVNAFTTANGIIFVNIGLMAQLENEAQLAYILCHEITHYKKQHSLLGFKFEKNLEKKVSKTAYRKNNQDNFLTKCAFNKNQEIEADEEGLRLFKKSGYSLEAIDGVFDVLEFANLPFDEVPFNKRFFEDKLLKFPDDFQLADSLLKPVSEGDDDDDAESTHPSIRKRRKIVSNLLEGIGKKDRKNYIVSKTEFELNRKIARFELLHLYLLNHDYEYALYSAFILSEAGDSNSYYVNKTIVKSLYALTKVYALEGDDGYKTVHTDYEKIEGASGSLYFLIEKMHEEPIAMNILALKRAWKLKDKYPADEEIEKICDELLLTLTKEHKASFSDFEDYSIDEKKDELIEKEKKVEEEETTTKKSKYNKLKKARKETIKKESSGKSYLYAGMAELVKDLEFRKAFKKAENVALSITKKDEDGDKKNKKKKYDGEEEQATSIDKVIISEPFYYKVDLRKKEAFKQEESERALINLDEKISRLSQLAQVDAVRYNSKTFTAADVDVLNNIMLINDYLRDNGQNTESGLIKVDYKGINNLIEKNKTPYLMNMGILYAIEDKDDMGYHYALCVVTAGLYTPFLIYQLMQRNVSTYIMYETIDLRTGKYLYDNTKKINSSDKDYIIEMHLYDMLLQLKHPKK
ncbi:MAG: M48 family metallopeptidase [Bacteroidota bacterium]|nr:M48 family metallopeptidase [Bacteroidota bacterium]